MKNKKLKIIFILLLFIYLFVPNCYSGEDKDLYYRGLKAARQGRIEAAFAYFNIVLNNFDKSDKYDENALFAVGEYYFSIKTEHDTKATFRRAANDYPESITGLLALGYLFKIAKDQEDQEQMEALKKKIVGFKQVSLLFKESEELDHVSAMQKNYKVVYFIDKVEIYINGEIFEEIPF